MQKIILYAAFAQIQVKAGAIEIETYERKR